MPVLLIAIALTLLVALLVAAVGPALRIAQRRTSHGGVDDVAYVPVAWRAESATLTTRRFVPEPAPTRERVG